MFVDTKEHCDGLYADLAKAGCVRVRVPLPTHAPCKRYFRPGILIFHSIYIYIYIYIFAHKHARTTCTRAQHLARTVREGVAVLLGVLEGVAVLVGVGDELGRQLGAYGYVLLGSIAMLDALPTSLSSDPPSSQFICHMLDVCTPAEVTGADVIVVYPEHPSLLPALKVSTLPSAMSIEEEMVQAGTPPMTTREPVNDAPVVLKSAFAALPTFTDPDELTYRNCEG